MFLRRFAVVALMALGFTAAAQESVVVENKPYTSASGRYAAIVRRYDVPDFKSVAVVDAPFQAEESVAEFPFDVPLVLYDMQTHAKIVETKILWEEDGDVFVSDSGHFLAVFRSIYHGCTGVAGADERLVTIFRSDGSRVGALKVGDVITDWDLMNRAHVEAQLAGDVLVVTIDGSERRIDVRAAKLLDEKRDVHPRPRVLTSDVGNAVRHWDYQPSPGFDDTGAIHIPSKELLAHLLPVDEPAFPVLAMKARIRGNIFVQVVVDEDGAVQFRTTPLPFITEAAVALAKQWQFSRFVLDGHRVKVTGELVIHFVDPQ